MNKGDLSAAINGALDVGLAGIADHMKEIETDQELRVQNAKEYEYGYVMGMSMSLSGALISMMTGKEPTVEEHEIARQIIYKRIPEIRSRIFGE